MPMTERTRLSTNLKVHIRRSKGATPNLFFVPFERPILVLDILHWIQRNGDATLAYSYSCRSARCGTCSVLVNRRPVLACQELIKTCNDAVTIEPLKGLPVIRDLIVDMQPFLSHWRKVKPFLGSDTTDQDPVLIPGQSPERRVIDAARGCIKCGICHSSCGMSGNDRSFLGPAALNHAVALIADSRDRAAKARLNSVLSEDGIDGCHYHGSCARLCPRSLDPAAAIMRLRRWRLSRNP